MNPPSSITKKFVTEDGVLGVTFEFTYEDAAPYPKLESVTATIVVHPEMSQEPVQPLEHSPPDSPPSGGTTVAIRLKGETHYDFQQAGMQVQGDFRLQALQVPQYSGGVWMDVSYGAQDLSHFEGITVLFQWILT